jgi:LPS-assembly lipoprotein
MWSQARLRLTVLGLSLAVLLSACGFQLRGQIELPPGLERIQVTGLSQNHALRRQLERFLEANGVEIIDNPEAKVARLDLSKYRQEKDILVVGTDGRVREYRLMSAVNASLRSAEGEDKMPSTRFDVFRDFIYDPDDVLGKAEEEKQLREDMVSELSRQIIQSLGSLIRQ